MLMSFTCSGGGGNYLTGQPKVHALWKKKKKKDGGAQSVKVFNIHNEWRSISKKQDEVNVCVSA